MFLKWIVLLFLLFYICYHYALIYKCIYTTSYHYLYIIYISILSTRIVVLTPCNLKKSLAILFLLNVV